MTDSRVFHPKWSSCSNTDTRHCSSLSGFRRIATSAIELNLLGPTTAQSAKIAFSLWTTTVRGWITVLDWKTCATSSFFVFTSGWVHFTCWSLYKWSANPTLCKQSTKKCSISFGSWMCFYLWWCWASSPGIGTCVSLAKPASNTSPNNCETGQLKIKNTMSLAF